MCICWIPAWFGRDKQLDYADYLDAQTGILDDKRFTAELSDPTRTMMGPDQFSWLQQ